MTKRLRILPLGGLGEIGKNMTVVEYGDRLLVVDAGVRFPTPEMHGIDLVIPDIRYLLDRRDQIEGIVLTHGHEDHIGALPWVIRQLGDGAVPVIHARELPAAMVKSKLDEHRLRTPIETLEPGDRRHLGPFEIELVHMTHSIPDSAAVAITAPVGTVLFTGDYRFDQTPVDGEPADLARLARFGSEGLLLLCGDSTNADREGFARSESDVGPHLHDVFAGCDGRIIVTSFASNIHRVQQVIAAAEDLGRRVALVGRSMVKNVKIGRRLGHIQAAEGTLVDLGELRKLPDEQVVIVTTGSQGEPLAALRRMAYGEHRQIELHEGDTVVFSATPIPGNERSINDTIDRLTKIGCAVVTAADAPIHASGHGHREELKLMLNLTRPKYLLPIHGDHKRIRLHAKLAEDVGMDPVAIFRSDNGIPLDIDGNGARLGDPVDSGIVLVDGVDLGDPTETALRERRSLSGDGVIFIVATVAESGGDTLADHEVILRGVPLVEDEEDFAAATRSAVEDSLDVAADREIDEPGLLEKHLHDDVAKFVYGRIKRRPMVVPVVVQI